MRDVKSITVYIKDGDSTDSDNSHGISFLFSVENVSAIIVPRQSALDHSHCVIHGSVWFLVIDVSDLDDIHLNIALSVFPENVIV